MWPNPQFPADLVTFTEEILNGKLHFLLSGRVDSEMNNRFISLLSKNTILEHFSTNIT